MEFSFPSARFRKSGFQRIGHDLVDLVFPASCQLCASPASPVLDRVLCSACAADWPLFEWGCPVCGRLRREKHCPDPSGSDGDSLDDVYPDTVADEPEPCSECVGSSPLFARARSLVLYEGKVVEAVHAFKYRNRRALATLLGKWMAAALPGLMERSHYHYVLPIPIHWQRRLSRGYNQAELLARPIADSMGIPLELGMKRLRSTRKQAQLGQKDRQRNLANAFFLPEPVAARLWKADILVIDDVFTTGATTRACSLALRDAGVGRIDVLTLARTA